MTPRPLLAAAAALTLAVLLPVPADWRAGDAGRDGETAPEPSYYSLNLYDTWTYSLGGNKFTLKVVRHERFAGVDCARVEMQNDGRAMSYEHVALRDGGVYRFGFEGAPADPPVLFLKLPARPGEEWKVNSKIGKEAITGTWKTAAEETVTVPAGTFRAVSVVGKFKGSGVDYEATTYFARGVGMVKQKVQMGGQTITIELEKFQPRGGMGGGR
jgi:hypothetical protein